MGSPPCAALASFPCGPRAFASYRPQRPYASLVHPPQGTPLQSSFSRFTAPRLSAKDTTYQGSRPSLDITLARPHTREHPTLALFRPQAFATSRRFSPHHGLQAYFVPLPSPGSFPFRGFSLRAAYPPSSRGPAPLPFLQKSLAPEDVHDSCLSTSRPSSTRRRVSPVW